MKLLLKLFILLLIWPGIACAQFGGGPFGGGGSSSGGSAPSGSGTELQYRGGASTLSAVTGSSVDSNGNVGIGTATPSYALHVVGNIRATSLVTDPSNTPQTDYYPTLAGDTHYIVGVSGDGGADNDDNWVVSEGTTLGSSNRISIAPGGIVTIPTITSTTFSGNPNFSGNVGINSATPGQILDVQGTIRILNGNVGIGTAISSALVSIAGGNVGIGTWVAGQATNIAGIATLSILENANMGILIKGKSGNNSGNADFSIESASNNGSWDVAVADSANGNIATGSFTIYDNKNNKNPFYIEPGASDKSIYIKTSGNIGIGSSNPGRTLDVFGTIRAIGIGTTTPELLCRKPDGTFGVAHGSTFNGTCN